MIQELSNRPGLVIRVLILISFCLSLRAANPSLALELPSPPQSETVLVLEPGSPVEKELAGGQSHTFRVSLESGQFLRVVVEQQGVDVAVEVAAPDGRLLAEMDGPYGRRGPESISIESSSKGDYKINVRSNGAAAPAGRYSIRIQALRPPAPGDDNRIKAERAVMEARRLGPAKSEDGSYPALKKFELALSYWEKAEDLYEQGRTLYRMGEILRMAGKPKDAASYFERALAIQEQDREERWDEAYTLTALGRTYGEVRPDKALEYATRGLALWKELGDDLNKALVLNILGGINQMLGNPEETRNYWMQALEIRAASNDIPGQISTLSNLGTYMDSLGESQHAVNYYYQALSLAETVQNPNNEELNKKATILANIGYTYQSLGNFEGALRYLNQALEIRTKINDLQLRAHTLLVIGDTYAAMGDAQAARDYYNRALPMAIERQDPWLEAYVRTGLGQVHASMNNYKEALASYDLALKLQTQQKNRFGQADILNKLGQAYIALGNRDIALEKYEQALPIWRDLEDARGEAAALHGLAQVESQLGDLTRALRHSDEAVSKIESLRSKAASQQLRSSYLALVRGVYDLQVDLRMRMHKVSPSGGHQAAAFLASEGGRARSLLDMLSEGSVNFRGGIDPRLIERKRSLQHQINAKAARQMRVRALTSSEAEKAAAAKDLEDTLTLYKEVEIEVAAKSPAYAALTQPQPASLSDVQNTLLDSDTLLLEYSLGDARSYLWAVSRSSVSTHELPGRKEIEDAARNVYESLTARQPGKDESPKAQRERLVAADARYAVEAARLSRMLLGPVASQLGARRLVIVSEGALQYVPFESLPAPSAEGERGADGSLRPLISDHEISYLASASVLAVLRKEAPKRKPAEKAVAVIADPVYEPDDPRVEEAGPALKKIVGGNGIPRPAQAVIRSGEFQMSRLAHSGEEGRAILALAPGEKSLLVTGFSANRTLAENDELNRYRVIHFAAHGIVNNKNPELSGIVLSLVDEKGGAQDGFLRLHDIYNLKLSADLVVLSACDTGLGKNIRGEGLVGLTRGFMYAGAPRVIASLWKVDDQATASLMSAFYRNMLREGMKPASALRAAKVEISKQKRWSAPYYWAGFVLQGDWQ